MFHLHIHIRTECPESRRRRHYPRMRLVIVRGKRSPGGTGLSAAFFDTPELTLRPVIYLNMYYNPPVGTDSENEFGHLCAYCLSCHSSSTFNTHRPAILTAMKARGNCVTKKRGDGQLLNNVDGAKKWKLEGENYFPNREQ